MFRPVRSAWRDGEHKAVVWNRLYFNPLAARRSAVGVLQAPPNALEAPKPTSSRSTINTFGAPAGGRNGTIGGYLVLGSLASWVVSPTCFASGIGRMCRGSVAFASAIAFAPFRTCVRVLSRPSLCRNAPSVETHGNSH